MLKEETFNPKNTAFIEGYLKENTLVLDDKQGANGRVVKGSLTIAIDDINSYKMQFYVSENKRNGEHSATFDSLLELLPAKTQTIAQFLSVTPNAVWEVAANAASKIWMIGSIEEYVRIKDGKEQSLVTYRGTRAGFKNATDARPFEPRATFEVDMYIEQKIQEKDDNGAPTGRLIITGLLQDARKGLHRVNFIAEGKAVEHIDAKYQVTQTACFRGIIKSAQIKTEVATSDDEDDGSWGSCAGPQYETTFVRERVITGGKPPVNQGEKMSFSKEDIKAGLAKREEAIASNSEDKNIKVVDTPKGGKNGGKKKGGSIADGFDDFNADGDDDEEF